MTDKKLKVSSAAYTELAIQIAVLQASVDKLLQLAMKPVQVFTDDEIDIMCGNDKIVGINEEVRVFMDETKYKPVQVRWPNESHTDYLKRIGQYNEAQSTTETFDEEFK